MTSSKTQWGVGAALLALVAGAAAWLTRSKDGVPSIEPLIGPMQAEGAFDFAVKPRKTRLNVSGVAFTRPGLAFFAFDEGLEGRFAELTETGFVARSEPVPIRTEGEEVDAEAAATDGRYLFVTGSHSTKRKGGDNDDSRLLVRFALGPDGLPARTKSGAFDAPDRGDILAAIRAQPVLAEALGRPLDDGSGLNIEGLAVSGGKLFFGFRGPTDGDHAYVLSLDAAAPFSDAALEGRLHRVPVGAGRGVRDMTAVEGGFLLLAGPDDRPANKDAGYVVAFWDGASEARPLARLSLPAPRQNLGDKEVKPETIAVTKTRADAYRVVVLCDGMVDGGPMWFDVPR